MSGRPFQSKLLPHANFIRECRGRHETYVQIAVALRERFGLSIAPSSVFSFVKVRARRRAVYSLPEPAVPPRPRAVVPLLKKPAINGGSWIAYDPSKPLEKQP
jgi:hypothetical protein